MAHNYGQPPVAPFVQSLFDKAEFQKRAAEHHNARVDYDSANEKAQQVRLELESLSKTADDLETSLARSKQEARRCLGIKGRTAYARIHLMKAAMARKPVGPNDTWAAKGLRGAYAALFVSLVERETDRIFTAMRRRMDECPIAPGDHGFEWASHERLVLNDAPRYGGNNESGARYRSRVDTAVAMGVAPEHFSFTKLAEGTVGENADRINPHDLAETMGLSGMTQDLGYEQIAQRIGAEIVRPGLRRVAEDGLLRDAKLKRWPTNRRQWPIGQLTERVHVDDYIRERIGEAYAPRRPAKQKPSAPKA